MNFETLCPICSKSMEFSSEDDFWSGRSGLLAERCPLGTCLTRERALSFVLKTIYDEKKIKNLRIHESSPCYRGISRWLAENCSNYVASSYFPDRPLGTCVGRVHNEDLENQTFSEASFDLVIHLDVLEHLFDPFKALREIYRTLSPDGICVFTAPTQWAEQSSKQVAFLDKEGKLEIKGTPEYHGNPFDKKGSLVTWRYGYDLPLLVMRETNFDVEVRRFQSRNVAAIGVNTEVYILSKFSSKVGSA